MGQALEQFETNPLWAFKFLNFEYFGYVLLTNFNITLVFLTISILFFFLGIFSYKTVFISYYELLIEKCYKFILNIVLNQTSSNGEKYFPLFLIIFLFILFSNIISLIPDNFCITSQLLVTFTLSISVFIGFIIISIQIQKQDFIYFFVPKNVPAILLPFLILIEIVSYISRVFSLALRLFANMVAGHALVHILSGAMLLGLYKLGSVNTLLIIFMFFPIALLLAIIGLEIGIAFLQAYVFIVLCTIYLNDSFGHSH